MSKISDIYYIKTILDRATAGSYNGQTGYYSVSDNMFAEGHSCYCDNGSDWYSDLKGIFNCDTTDFSGGGLDQQTLLGGSYHMTIVKMAANNYLSVLFGGVTINLNFDGNYYYTQDYYSSYGGTLYRFDYINGAIVYNTTYVGGSFATVSENVETTLFSSASIMMYYSNADRNINYATIRSEQGIGSGGWQVPNPNPTYKIVVNGVNYSQPNETDDILVHHFDVDLATGDKTYDNKGHEWSHSSSTQADIDVVEKKFGDGCLWISTQGAYVQSEAINELNFGSGDFTIDFWIYIDTNTGRMCPLTWTTDGIAIDISNYYPRMWMIDPSGSSWLVHADSAAGGGQGTIALTPYTWQHIALVRNGSYLTLYVDGQQSVQANIGTAALRFTANTTAILLGKWNDMSSYPFNGRIDELRITNKAVWTAAFTPPTVPYEDGFSTDIKLNGATPLKIMLNGVCYYERQSSAYLHNWDLTSSTADSVGGTELQYYLNDSSDTTANVANKSGLYTSGTGVTFSDQNDVNGIVLPVNLYTPGNVLEVDFTNFQVTYTMMEWGQIMVQTHKCQGSYNTDYGIHWGVGGDYSNWFLTSNYDLGSGNTSYGYCDITNSTQAQLFANSTLKIKVISSANNRTQWEIYKDDTLLATTPELNNSSTYPFMLANASDTDNLFMLSPNYLNATVTGIRIYQE